MSPSPASPSATVQSLLAARSAGQLYEPPSKSIDGMNLSAAYRMQREFVDHSGETIAGFKGAVTAPAAQAAMGLQAPATGVLFTAGLREPGTTVDATDFRTLAIEAEIGFRICEPISTPIDLNQIRRVIGASVPMIELADPGMTRPFSGVDLIATNCASAQFIVGPELDPAIDLDTLVTSTSRDGQPLGSAAAGTVLGGQYLALHWLINVIVGLGYSIKPGDLMMTGAIGHAFPGQPGRYDVSFAEAGRLTFTVV